MKQYLSLILLILAACGAQTEPLAKLTFVSGDVLVNGAAAGLNHAVKQGDLIQTLGGAQATITFYNSSIVRLSESTTLELSQLTESKLVTLKQSTGETWTRVLKVTGIGEYKIEAPNTVATVRGTGFSVSVLDNQTEVTVGEGTVHVAQTDNGATISEINVNADEKAVIARARSDEKRERAAQIRIEHARADKKIQKHLQEDNEHIKKVLERPNYAEIFAEIGQIENDAREIGQNARFEFDLPSEQNQDSSDETDSILENLEDEPQEPINKTIIRTAEKPIRKSLNETQTTVKQTAVKTAVRI